MGKRKLMTGIVLGASIGGLLSLMNEDARRYAKQKANQTFNCVQNSLQNPAESVRKMKEKVETINELVTNNASSAVNALEQVESSLNKLLTKKDE